MSGRVCYESVNIAFELHLGPSDVQIEILYYGVCHSNGPFKVELPP